MELIVKVEIETGWREGTEQQQCAGEKGKFYQRPLDRQKDMKTKRHEKAKHAKKKMQSSQQSDHGTETKLRNNSSS